MKRKLSNKQRLLKSIELKIAKKNVEEIEQINKEKAEKEIKERDQFKNNEKVVLREGKIMR